MFIRKAILDLSRLSDCTRDKLVGSSANIQFGGSLNLESLSSLLEDMWNAKMNVNISYIPPEHPEASDGPMVSSILRSLSESGLRIKKT